MKRILILAYDFPPYISVGGQRPHSWFLHFHKFGIYPIVITRQWRNRFGDKRDYIDRSEYSHEIIEHFTHGLVIRAPYRPSWSNQINLKHNGNKFSFIRKILSGITELLQWIFKIGTKYTLYQAANKYLKENRVDIILATGDPFILFKYANKLSKKYSLPWISDYRDPWNNDAHYKPQIQKIWENLWEHYLMKTVSFATTTCDFHKNYISKHIPKDKIKIIENGFNPELLELTQNSNQNIETFSIGFTGTINAWDPIECIIDTYALFLEKHPYNINFNFYGTNRACFIEQYIKTKYPLFIKYFNFYPKEKQEEMIKKLATNNIFLLFNSYSYTGTKIFDYMALQRLIILCFEDEPEARRLKKLFYQTSDIPNISNQIQYNIIKDSNSGIYIKDKEHLLEFLNTAYDEFGKNRGIKINSTNITKYSRLYQTEKLAHLIHDYLNNR